MKKNLLFFLFYATATLLLWNCAPKSVASYSPIQVTVPERPAGQTDVVGLTAPPLDTVRVGFI